MTAKRAAAYCGGGLLLLAGLSYGSARVGQVPPVEEPRRPVETTGTATLAADVQAQTARLKARMAEAPAPLQPSRNPFAFAPREEASPRARRSARVAEPQAEAALLPPAEPAIELVGVAESQTPTGIVRTAVISALSGDLFLVKEGETIAARYRVKAVSSTAVELSDLITGQTRRLALRE
ncbi:MAG TPA: hypothetical protein VFJ02_14240 [Vicinamibacterales bacterium]|nr:hypothetical protein [Vicinamibacterales bacterium]